MYEGVVSHIQILRDGLEVTDIHPGKGPAAATGDMVKARNYF